MDRIETLFNNGKLMHGDCLDLMPLLPDKSIDLILTDPPYGITNADWDKVPNDKIFLERRLKTRIGKGLKPIIMIDKNNEEILFKSSSEASLIKKISRTSIINCLNNRARTAGGFKWIYAN
jgi:DNA modification methylase